MLNRCTLVKILAVLTHPKQGDLHHPNKADVVKPFDEAVPDYADSLRSALNRLKTDLQNDSSEYAAKSLELIHALENEYFPHK